MSGAGFFQLLLLCVVLAVTVIPLGRYMAAVYGVRRAAAPDRSSCRSSGSSTGSCATSAPEAALERATIALLAFSVVVVPVRLRHRALAGSLFFNPTNMVGVPAFGAFNVAVSFMTNTNWQWYSGEVTMSHLTQMLGLAVQNFVSAAAGMAIAVALIRGITRRSRRTLGNFWVDLVRSTLRILLPLSFVVALLLAAGGVVQNFHGGTDATPVDGAVPPDTSRFRAVGGQPDRHQAARHNGGGFELGAPVRTRGHRLHRLWRSS